MPGLSRPLQARLPQILRVMHNVDQAGQIDFAGNLFIHEGEDRVWVTHHDMLIGYLFHPGVDRPNQAEEISRICGPRMLSWVQFLHRHWPHNGSLWMSADQVVWVGPDGIKAVRAPGPLHTLEYQWHGCFRAWRTVAENLLPGEVAIPGSFHQKIEMMHQVQSWAGQGWTLSAAEMPMPTSVVRPVPHLVFRLHDQAVLCQQGQDHPEFVHAWRL